MPAPRVHRYSNDIELKAAVTVEALRELNETFNRETLRTTEQAPVSVWTEEQSRDLCDARPAPDVAEFAAARQRAALVVLQLREAALAFEAWAREVEEGREQRTWVSDLALLSVGPVLLPLVREPMLHRQVFTEEQAQLLRLSAAPLPSWDPIDLLICTLDAPLLPGPDVKFNAFGLHRAATDREIALVLLSAGYFPRSLTSANGKLANVIDLQVRTVRRRRRGLWRTATDGQYIGPCRPASNVNDTDEGDDSAESDP